jgi:hypothetical protein
MKSGQAPLRTFGDLKQFFEIQHPDAEKPARQKKRRRGKKASPESPEPAEVKLAIPPATGAAEGRAEEAGLPPAKENAEAVANAAEQAGIGEPPPVPEAKAVPEEASVAEEPQPSQEKSARDIQDNS